jgi:hypothetical protein
LGGGWLPGSCHHLKWQLLAAYRCLKKSVGVFVFFSFLFLGFFNFFFLFGFFILFFSQYYKWEIIGI